ncbi:MAG TPA: hypothetical protein VLH56_11465 [Dissulfurispiraceae bacterium]|nr:hypothetical protein [Dissulfurispiraceae bacterium]
MNIQFFEQGHRYTIDGAQVPSVTQILKILEPYDGWPEDAAVRGTHVHTLCELYDQDDLDPESIAPEYAGYLDAWIKFKAENPLKIDFSILKYEQVLGSKLGYAGTADRLSSAWILDIKTGAPTRTHPHQLHAYNMAAIETYGGKKRAMADIYLSADGTYKPQIVKWDNAAWDMFRSALNVHNFKHGGLR